MALPYSTPLYEQADLVEVARFVLRQEGKPYDRDEVVFHSPDRPDTNASVYVNRRKKVWHDFGGRSGGVRAFVREYVGLDERGVTEWLLDWTNNRAVAPTLQIVPKSTEETPKNAEHYAPAVEAGVAELWNGSAESTRVLDYLRQSRHLDDEQIRAARIGWRPAGGKVGGKGLEGILLPRYNAAGQLQQLKVRQIVGELAEWLGVPEARKSDGTVESKYTSRGSAKGCLYGDAELDRDDVASVLLVEGEFDALVLRPRLADAAVVTAGSASSPLSPPILERLAARRLPVYISLDADGAGLTSAVERLAELQRVGLRAVIMPALPAGKDATDAVRAGTDVRAWYTARPVAPTLPLQLTTTQRGALIRVVGKTPALAFERITQAISTDNLAQPFTVADAAELSELSSNAAYRALVKLAERGFFAKTETSPRLVAKSAKNPSGRPAAGYSLLPFGELNRVLLNALQAREVQRYSADECAKLDVAGWTRALSGHADDQDIPAAAQRLAAFPIEPTPGQDKARRALASWARALATDTTPAAPVDASTPAEYQRGVTRLVLQASADDPRPQYELARELGCSSSRVSTLARAAGFAVERIAPEVEYVGAEARRKVYADAKRERAAIIGLSVHGGEYIKSPTPADFDALPADARVTVYMQAPNRYPPAPPVIVEDVAPALPAVEARSVAPAEDRREHERPPRPVVNLDGFRADWLEAQIARQIPRIDEDGVLRWQSGDVRAAVRALATDTTPAAPIVERWNLSAAECARIIGSLPSGQGNRGKSGLVMPVGWQPAPAERIATLV